jgi:DNA polymerase IV (DinB-like DNA polymerase)
VEERDKPRLKGLPIAVGSDPAEGKGRGVVSTANYKAREYGIHSALPISTAWKLSEKAKKEGKPEVVFLPVDFEKYGEVSEKIMEIIKKYSDVVEVASIDEAYFDLSPHLMRRCGDLSSAGDYKKATEICKKIKKEIYEKERLTCSIGIGPNKLISKISSGFKKPDGLTIIGSDDEATCTELVEEFLEPLNIRKIPGIGPKAEEKFNKIGIKIVKDLKKIGKNKLEEMMGKWGTEIYNKARGIDDSPLITEWEAKSIGDQATFLQDTKDANEVMERITELSQQVFGRFEDSGFKSFKNITIAVRFSDFETKTRSYTLKTPASDLKTLEFEVIKMFLPFLDKRENPKNKSIRLLGVRIEKFE